MPINLSTIHWGGKYGLSVEKVMKEIVLNIVLFIVGSYLSGYAIKGIVTGVLLRDDLECISLLVSDNFVK
jgi:hypothetical protein